MKIVVTCLLGMSVCLPLTGCRYTNVPPPRAAAQLFPREESSTIQGGLDFVEGPQGVIVSGWVSNLPTGNFSLHLQDQKGCEGSSERKLADLLPVESNEFLRGDGYVPGASLTHGTMNVVGRTVAVRSGSGAPLACGDIKKL